MVHLSEEKIIAVTPADVRLAVLEQQKYVVASPSGPQGPQGPIGPAGGDVVIYDRAGIPASTWTVNHSLGRLVHITVVGDDGKEVHPDVDQSNVNVATITFPSPFSGKALVG